MILQAHGVEKYELARSDFKTHISHKVWPQFKIQMVDVYLTQSSTRRKKKQ
jgi:hypothetical protein